MGVTTKNTRIDFRIDDENKIILEKAASINHLSVTSYIVSVVLKQAELDIRNHEILSLNKKDAKLVMDLLDDTIEPNDYLIRLMK